jgi:hypothetical protein
MVSQNNSFLLLSCFSQVFYYSGGKLARAYATGFMNLAVDTHLSCSYFFLPSMTSVAVSIHLQPDSFGHMLLIP